MIELQGQRPRQCSSKDDLESVQIGEDREEGDVVPGEILHVSILRKDHVDHH